MIFPWLPPSGSWPTRRPRRREMGSRSSRRSEASPGEPLASDLACVDLLHRVWPDFDLPPQVDHACLPAKTLGDFRLIRELGRGGMGTVYEAEQLSMGRHVALKVLPFAALVDDKSLQRFRNEVRAAAALDHPHIVSVYSVGRRARRPLLRDATHSRADSGGHDRGVAKDAAEPRVRCWRRATTRRRLTRRSTQPPSTMRDEQARDQHGGRLAPGQRSSIARPPDSASRRPRPCSTPTTKASCTATSSPAI